MKTIAVIDGNSLMHRAFHAVPTYMTSPDGRPTNACFGFVSMLLKLVDEFKPDGIICAFDAGVPAFRIEAINHYKAQRPPTDPDLKSQFPLIIKLLESLNIPIYSLDGWEGDDILGTVATQAENAGVRALLVTGDKDALQLASDTTQIVNTKTGMTDVVVYGPEQVVERFGVTPERVPDFLGLMGDSSDNIPGIPGVGPKTATKLLQQYGTLESVLDNAASIKGKVGENVANNADLAHASKTVATIIRDLPLDIDFEALSFPDFDEQQAKEAFGELAMMQHLRKVLALQQVDAPEVEPDEKSTLVLEPHLDGSGSDSSEAAAFLEREIRNDQVIAVHIDENPGASLFEATRQLFIATAGGTASFSEQELPKVLAQIVRQGRLVAHDVKSLLREILPPNSTLPAQIAATDIDSTRIFDLSIAAYLLDSSKDYQKLATLREQYLSTVLPDPTEALPEGVITAAVLLDLHTTLKPAIESDHSRECFERIEMPLIPVLLQMERLGVNIDVEVLNELSRSFAVTISRLRAEIIDAAGEEFNPDSPKQLGVILFEKLRLPVGKKTRTGYSTDAATLTDLAALHPLPNLMMEYRELTKLKSTYLDALPRLIASDKPSDRHIHTTFNQAVTATGRLSSSDPNLQNIPVRSDLGRQIRAAFIPDASALRPADADLAAPAPEALLLSADYSQIELRLLAHLSEDPGLMEAFQRGQDFHAATASQVFGVPIEEVTSQLRSRAKAVNFGIVYGQQAYGLSQSLGIPYKEADEMIERYFAVYPQVRVYLDSLIAQARADGWVATMFGRKRHIHELRSSNPNLRGFGERTAMNHPLQGSAADIIKLAMIEIQRRLDTDGYVSQMILQVHDELVFNCAASEAKRLSAMVLEVMEHVVELRVPVLVDIGTGVNWSEAH